MIFKESINQLRLSEEDELYSLKCIVYFGTKEVMNNFGFDQKEIKVFVPQNYPSDKFGSFNATKTDVNENSCNAFYVEPELPQITTKENENQQNGNEDDNDNIGVIVGVSVTVGIVVIVAVVVVLYLFVFRKKDAEAPEA